MGGGSGSKGRDECVLEFASLSVDFCGVVGSVRSYPFVWGLLSVGLCPSVVGWMFLLGGLLVVGCLLWGVGCSLFVVGD